MVAKPRGYNLSEKPAGVGSYRVNLLSDDVIGLMDALGYEKVILVGTIGAQASPGGWQEPILNG